MTADLRGARVVVTGGAGFIGSNLVHRLVALGATVAVVDAFLPATGANPWNLQGLDGRIALHRGDCGDTAALAPLVAGSDVIYNIAGQVSHADSMSDPQADLLSNCRAPLGVLEACRRQAPAARVVHTATRQQYGRPAYLPVDERHPLAPTDVNGINKTAGEAYHLLYHRVHGLPTVSLRLANTYGPRQLVRHARQGFAPWFVRRVLDGETLEVFGDGRQLRDFTYVDDVVDALLLAATSPAAVGEVYNLGGERPYSVLEFVELLLAAAGRGEYRVIPFPDDARRIDVGSIYAHTGKIERALGWRPRVGLAEGLARTLEFYRRHRAHYW